MYDTIIRGAQVVDGTGAEARTADIAITDGRIAEIGQVSATAHETIDADGAVATPGFIDVHTHYDGQFLWDDRLEPSLSHGITTAIAGNCGVGFAPVRPEHRQELIALMEGVEDIPEATLTDGLDWNWRSFPDYLDRLAERRFSMDVAAKLTHAPLRVFVMGERALRHEEASAADVQDMVSLVEQAMAAGAIGFSAARIVEHRSTTGNYVPGTFAAEDELIALGEAMGRGGHGVFQIIPQGAVGSHIVAQGGPEARIAEHRLFEEIARHSGRPLTYSLTQFASDPDDFEMMLQASDRAVAAGLSIHPQIATRAIGLLTMLDGYHIFMMRPSYREVADLPLPARVAALRDPARRRAILAEADDDSVLAGNPAVLGMVKRLQGSVASSYILESELAHEPTPERRVGVLANGRSPEEALYDHYTRDSGRDFNVTLSFNYTNHSLDFVPGAMARDNVICGLGDGGAHVRMISDASLPTFQLAYWARERTRGPRLPLPLAVHKLTGAPAQVYGLDDRGRLKPGRRADINIIDIDRLGYEAPNMVADLPGGGRRLLQRSHGYLATLVAGTVTRRFDEETGARPGRLIRSGQRR